MELIETNLIGAKIVSEDRFIENMAAMKIRKDFCCKKLIETFVHRLMASGLYFKDRNDNDFVRKLPFLLKHREKDTSKRKLTLMDFAPAFIFLLTGYFISFLVFICEILLNCKTAGKFLKTNKKKKKKKNNM